ncbi:MAG: PorV/PorQ family protein [Saprospiraceae bacterium]
MKQLLLSLLGCFLMSFATAQTIVVLGNTNANPIFTSVPELQLSQNVQDIGFGGIYAVNPRHDYASSNLKNPAMMSSTDRTWNTSLNFSNQPLIYQGELQVAYQNKKGLSYGGLIRAYVFPTDRNFIDANNNLITVTENSLTATAGGFIAKKLGKHWSIGTSLNFLYSKLAGQDLLGLVPTQSFYMDLGVNYHTHFSLKDHNLELNTGLTINHIGPKTNYYSPTPIIKGFLPTKMALAAALTYPVSVNNFKISSTFAYQAEKLLVPTPDTLDNDNNAILDYQERSAFSGMITSFNDGTYYGEEWQEIAHRFGLEVLVSSEKWVFGLRVGAMNQSPRKGNIRTRSIGLTIGRNGYLIHGAYQKDRWRSSVYSLSLSKQI